MREKWRDGEGLIAFVPRRLGQPLKATAAVVGFLVLILWDPRTRSRSRTPKVRAKFYPDRRVAIALVKVSRNAFPG